MVTHLFVVDDKRHRDLSIVGPLQALEAFLSVAFEVSGEGIVWRCGVDFRHVGICLCEMKLGLVRSGSCSNGY